MDGESYVNPEVHDLIQKRVGGTFNPVPDQVRKAIQHLANLRRIQTEMGGRPLPQLLGYKPDWEEIPTRQMSYAPTFWEDPHRVVRFHQGMQALPPDAPTPDWLDREKLGAAYKYLEYQNRGRPQNEWRFLNIDDPGRQFLQGMDLPPIEMLMPNELVYHVQQQQQKAELEGQAIQTMGWPEKGSPEWEELPGWMKVAMTTVASGEWYGQAIGGALTLGPWGLVTGFLAGGPPGAALGAFSGAITGAGLSLATGAANRWLANIREKHPDYEWTTDISKALESVLLAFDVGAEILERGMGMGVQIQKSIEDPERWGPLSDVISMAGWRAATQFYTALPLEGLIPGGAELGEKWILGLPEPQRQVVDPRTGQMIQLPQPQDMDEAWDMLADELTDCRQQLMTGSRSPDALLMDMAVKYGWSGQFTELVGHIVLDPGPFVARKIPETGFSLYGKLSDDTAMLAALEAIKTLPRSQRGFFGDIRGIRQHLRIGVSLEDVTAGGLLTRYLGGVSAEGEPAILARPRGRLGWLTALTPRAKATEVLANTSDMAKIIMDQFNDPLELGANWRKIAATPGEAAAELSMKFIESPDGMLTVMAMRDFGDGALTNLETQWVSTELHRTMLRNIAKLKGIPEAEVLRLFDNAEQAPALFKGLLDEAAKLADKDPNAAGLIDAAKAGQFTEQTLRDMLKLYTQDLIAWHPDHWKAELYSAWMTHIADWTVKRLGVTVEPMVLKMSNLMKSIQSIALLDVNPLYAINNGVNNISTMIVDGTFKMATIKQSLKWWDDFGLRPYRLRQAYGGVAGLEEFAGKSLAQLQKMAAESPEASRFVSEIMASRTLADAATGEGGLVTAQKMVSSFRRKTGFASAFSRRIEEWSSVQATTAGAQQFWSRTWKAGSGYSRMPPGLEDALGPNISRMIYGVVEGALNADNLEGALLREATIRGNWESFVDPIARELGIDPGDVSEIMTRSGAGNFLSEHLPEAKTPDDVRGVFSLLDQFVQRQIDQMAVAEYVSRVKHAAAQIQAGDYTGVLETWYSLNRSMDEWWTQHVMEWSSTIEEVYGIRDAKKQNQLVSARMAIANSEATRMQNHELAAIEGMVEGLRDIGAAVPESYVELLTTQHQTKRNFFRLRDDLWREYFKTEFDSKESRRLEYQEIVTRLDSEYGRLALETMQTQEQMDMAVVNMIARQDADLADGFNIWLTENREHRAVMVAREQNVRRANYDILMSDHATGKEFVTIIQAHFSGDPEFLKEISPWLQQLRGHRGKFSRDDMLTVRRRLYAEYLNKLKLPDIKDYFERRNQGVVEALGEDMQRPLPMPEAEGVPRPGEAEGAVGAEPRPEVPTPELKTAEEFARIQEALESGEASRVLSSGDIMDMIRRADEAIAGLAGDRTRKTAGGGRAPLWDQASRLSASTAEKLGKTPAEYWWSTAAADPEVRDGILGLPEINGSEEAAKALLQAIFEERQGTEGVDLRQVANDDLRKIASEQGRIPTSSESGAPLNAQLINWINSDGCLGLRRKGSPIKTLDDLTDTQRMLVRIELYKRGQRMEVLEKEAIRTGMTREALETLDSWKEGKPCGVRKLRRLGIFNGLNDAEAKAMSADEIHSWMKAKRTGEPYLGPRYMTPDKLHRTMLELSGDQPEVAQASMLLVEAAAKARGQTIEEYTKAVFEPWHGDENEAAFMKLYQEDYSYKDAHEIATLHVEIEETHLREAMAERGYSEKMIEGFLENWKKADAIPYYKLGGIPGGYRFAQIVPPGFDPELHPLRDIHDLIRNYHAATGMLIHLEKTGKPFKLGDMMRRTFLLTGEPVDCVVKKWFDRWQIWDKKSNRPLGNYNTETEAQAKADTLNMRGMHREDLPYTMLQRADYNHPWIQETIEHFGITKDPREAGYILPDGRMLDFSGRHLGETDLFGGPIRGGRLIEHSDIAEAFKSLTEQRFDQGATDTFVSETGSMRMNFNDYEGGPGFSIQMSGKPTPDQVSAVTRILGQFPEIVLREKGYLRIDCMDPVTGRLLEDIWVEGLTMPKVHRALYQIDDVYSPARFYQTGKGEIWQTKAVDMFGITYNPRDATYLLSDGALLSGRGEAGLKDFDHVDVHRIDPEIERSTEGIYSFMEESGAIRLAITGREETLTVNIEMRTRPTASQKRYISDLLRTTGASLSVDTWGKDGILATDYLPGPLYVREINAVFQKGDVDLDPMPAKGMAVLLDNGKAMLKALEHPDATSCIHELGHVFRWQLNEADNDVVVNWWRETGKLDIGHENGKLVGERSVIEAAEEMWARGFERYMSEGIAPTSELRMVFERFKRWIMAVYQKITGSAIDVEISDDVRGVMDRILASDADLARELQPSFDWASGEAKAAVAPSPLPAAPLTRLPLTLRFLWNIAGVLEGLDPVAFKEHIRMLETANLEGQKLMEVSEALAKIDPELYKTEIDTLRVEAAERIARAVGAEGAEPEPPIEAEVIKPPEIETVWPRAPEEPEFPGKPTWAGKESLQTAEFTVWRGRFEHTADQWAVDIEGKPGPWRGTPEEAVSAHKKAVELGVDLTAARRSWDSAMEHIGAGIATEADISIIADGREFITTTRAIDILEMAGFKQAEARKIVGRLGIEGETTAGAILRDPHDVVEYIKNVTPDPKKGMDLHDWQVRKNKELRQAEKIVDPQARIDTVTEIEAKYDKVKGKDWVTSNTLAARIRVRAKSEIRAMGGIPGLEGAGTAAHGPDPNVLYEFIYRVMELDNIVASHTLAGEPNPDYPDHLQPRDRARAVSQQQVKRIASDMNPDALLMPTTRIDDGTPIIGNDSVVESGNARIIALKEAAFNVPDASAAYKERLIELLVGNAEEYGDFDMARIRAMESPTLVRVRTSDVDRVEFTRIANESATMAMSFVESAQADINRLTINSLANLEIPEGWTIEQALRSPRNKRFVQSFVDQLPRNEVALAVDPDGELSRKGMERLIAAMFAKTYYGDSGVRLVRTVFESKDVHIMNIAKGLTTSLGEMAKAESLIAADRRPMELSLGEDLAMAVSKMEVLKSEGKMNIEEYIGQIMMFDRELTKFQEGLMLDLQAMIRSPKAIRRVLTAYAQQVQKLPEADQIGLFGKVEYPTKAELWDKAKQDPQMNFFQLPNESEMGALEGIPPELWMSQVTQDGWDQIRPVMDSMKEKMAGEDGWTREIGMEEVRSSLSPEQQEDFRGWTRGVKGDMASTKMGAVRWGQSQRDFSLLNYNARRGLDVGLTMGMPYWFWPSRTFLNWIMRAVDRPSLIANMARVKRLQSHYQTVPGFPQRLKGKIRVPMPFLPEWMGGGLWVDPLRSLFPPAMFVDKVDRVARSKQQEVGNAERIISNWVAEGKVDPSLAEHAIVSREGDIWERALDQARFEMEEEFAGPLDYVNLLTSFALPLEIGRQFLRGTPENIGPMPITRFIKGVTAPLGIGGPGGVNIEAPIRRAAGLPEFDKYEEYRIERMISNMIADGVVTPRDGEMAMHEHKGETWDEATRRVNMARFYGRYANPLFYLGFPADSFPTGEVAQRALARKFSAAMEARNAGDAGALNDFFDEYPEYESRLNLFKDPSERLRFYLVDEIWTRYMALGSSNKEIVRLQLGEDFMYSFLSTETRSYDDIPINTLAYWAKRLGAYMPETPEDRIEIPEDTRGVEILDPTLSLAVDTYREKRNSKFPNWYAVQQGYYKLEPGNDRRNYLVQFPMLKRYWDWRTGYYEDYPEVRAYNQRYDLETRSGEEIASVSVPEILTNTVLMRQIMGNRMTGQPLTAGALAELYRIWEGMGSPFDDMETWLKNLEMTEIAEGGVSHAPAAQPKPGSLTPTMAP